MSGRRPGFDRERVNVAFHKIIDGGVDEAVPGHREHAAKRLGHDANPKMTLTSRGAGVSRMEMTFVFHDELYRGKAQLQAFAKALRPIGRGPTHGAGGPDGAAVDGESAAGFALLLSHRTCGNMNTIVAGVMP